MTATKFKVKKIDISNRLNKTKTIKVTAQTGEITQRKGDAITDIEVINKYIYNNLISGKLMRAAYVLFGINTGLRYGDIVSLRVKDVMQDGKIIDGFNLVEHKTSANRSVYLNDTVKDMLKTVIKTKKLDDDDFIFCGDGNRKAYFEKFIYNDDGDIIDVVVTGDKYDADGVERKRTPIRNKTANEWYHGFTEYLDGHFTSHSARHTFRYFVSKTGIGDSYQDILLASQCMGHASVRTTMEHYCSVNESTKRKVANMLNLGKEGYIKGIQEKYGK